MPIMSIFGVSTSSATGEVYGTITARPTSSGYQSVLRFRANNGTTDVAVVYLQSSYPERGINFGIPNGSGSGSYYQIKKDGIVLCADSNGALTSDRRTITALATPTVSHAAANKEYVDSFYPVGTVYTSTSATAPTFVGTWTEIGTQTIGSATVHYYERTA